MSESENTEWTPPKNWGRNLAKETRQSLGDRQQVHVPGKGLVALGDLTEEDREARERGRHMRRWHDVTQAAKKLAYYYGLDPTLIEGSGMNGRVLKGDVERKLTALRERLNEERS